MKMKMKRPQMLPMVSPESVSSLYYYPCLQFHDLNYLLLNFAVWPEVHGFQRQERIPS